MKTGTTQYDVIVIGSGHAGVEAALASARLGSKTLLLTQNLDTVAQMSCNPAIGGLAKGQIVREIDALGGAMGTNADATGIQFRLLNRTKGPSVRAPRVQCDKKAYQFRMKAVLERAPNLDIKQATVSKVVIDDRSSVTGVETDIGMQLRRGSGRGDLRDFSAWVAPRGDPFAPRRPNGRHQLGAQRVPSATWI